MRDYEASQFGGRKYIAVLQPQLHQQVVGRYATAVARAIPGFDLGYFSTSMRCLRKTVLLYLCYMSVPSVLDLILPMRGFDLIPWGQGLVSRPSVAYRASQEATLHTRIHYSVDCQSTKPCIVG